MSVPFPRASIFLRVACFLNEPLLERSCAFVETNSFVSSVFWRNYSSIIYFYATRSSYYFASYFVYSDSRNLTSAASWVTASRSLATWVIRAAICSSIFLTRASLSRTSSSLWASRAFHIYYLSCSFRSASCWNSSCFLRNSASCLCLSSSRCRY